MPVNCLKNVLVVVFAVGLLMLNSDQDKLRMIVVCFNVSIGISINVIININIGTSNSRPTGTADIALYLPMLHAVAIGSVAAEHYRQKRHFQHTIYLVLSSFSLFI